nr:cyanophycin synthetase [Actinomadura sp. CNU-125]
MAAAAPAEVVFHGTGGDAAVRASGVTVDAGGHASCTLHAPSGDARVRLPLPGEHQVANAVAAASAATAAGVAPDRIAAALEAAVPRSPGRFRPSEGPDGVTIIDDAYNANPVSMRAALRTMTAMAAGRRRTIAVLGEMTGQAAGTAGRHADVGALAAGLGVSILVVVGDGEGPEALAAAARRADGFVHSVPDRTAAADRVRGLLRPDDLVLVKASSEVGLSAVAAALGRRTA